MRRPGINPTIIAALRLRRLVIGLASGLLAISPACGLPTTAGAHHDLQFSPTEGGTKTTFTVQFTADLSERNGPGGDPLDFYIVAIQGPKGCDEVTAFTSEVVAAGQLVTLPVSPAGILPLEARQWCLGPYRGSVYFCYCSRGDERPNVPVGDFDFVIGGTARYVGKTSQGKRISFKMPRGGKRITGLRVSGRTRCRFGGGRGSRTFPWGWTSTRGDDRRWPIRIPGASFRRTYRGRLAGGRFSLRITGRLTGGTFGGRLREREAGAGFRCSSGSVSWSAR
jgi:hypothetical protein